MFKAFLIKYAEIGLKGNNRYIFENALRDRIKEALASLGEYVVSKEQGRVFVECPAVYDYEETVEALQKVFGISSICPVAVIESSDWEILTKGVGD
jgi:thiamine biosynthesis protein ThiI